DANTPYSSVDYTDASGEEYTALPYDPYGGDFEGIVIDRDGNFWMCDENRPSIYKFAPNGTLIERYVPEGTSQLGSTPLPAGTYGAETLPSVYSKRRANRGFEAIAYDAEKHVVYAFIQSPIENPNSSVRNNSDVIRILGVSADDGTPVEEYVYLLENNRYPGLAASRVDKIGDAVYMGEGKFLVLERDSEGPGVTEGKKYVFEINLKGAT
ncbi:MAG: esterase-like activity of phytase family protein, partial [Saprospiraceae bacterium]|nr:esterase-like activity of phytase family protein [Saprospiraceae bacterium]